MSLETVFTVAGGLVLGFLGGLAAWVFMPKRLKSQYFVTRWRELQNFCKDKTTWPKAIADADKLLDRALKKRKFKGKTMGERLVSAQRSFTDNDGVWYAHNLAKKALADNNIRLKESDVKEALMCFRDALRDIGALPDGKSSSKAKRQA